MLSDVGRTMARNMILNTTPLPPTFDQFVKGNSDDAVSFELEDLDALSELWSNVVVIRSAISYKKKRQAQLENDRYFHDGWNPNYPE